MIIFNKTKFSRSKKLLKNCYAVKLLHWLQGCSTAKLFSVSALLFCNTAQSALLYPLNDLKVIEAEISRQGLTRITAKDDRILNVFGITGEYVLETDEEQGQIFIRPMGPGSLNHISLTLTTEKGHTQDLRLAPIDKPPEALILQAEEPSKEGLAKKHVQSIANRDELEALIQACQEERIPVGYKPMPLDLVPKKTGTQHKEYRLVREIRGPHLKGLTYEVKNTSQIPLVMAEQSFADRDVIAVSMPLRILTPGEKTHVYIIAKVTE